jgi:hypothetical protein
MDIIGIKITYSLLVHITYSVFDRTYRVFFFIVRLLTFIVRVPQLP